MKLHRLHQGLILTLPREPGIFHGALDCCITPSGSLTTITTVKGHRFLTIVMDLEGGVEVFGSDARGSDVLKRFWKWFHGSKALIEPVAMDMSLAYREAGST